MPDVVLVEPYLSGTSTHVLSGALSDLPHRVLALGVRRDVELRAYRSAGEHESAHGRDAAGSGTAIKRFLAGA
jgi:transketolase